jgi:hypothetical protein
MKRINALTAAGNTTRAGSSAVTLADKNITITMKTEKMKTPEEQAKEWLDEKYPTKYPQDEMWKCEMSEYLASFHKHALEEKIKQLEYNVKWEDAAEWVKEKAIEILNQEK